jgi:hypothetical protein
MVAACPRRRSFRPTHPWRKRVSAPANAKSLRMRAVAISAAAHRPYSSAIEMPSPMSGSTPAASPTRRTCGVTKGAVP